MSEKQEVTGPERVDEAIQDKGIQILSDCAVAHDKATFMEVACAGFAASECIEETLDYSPVFEGMGFVLHEIAEIVETARDYIDELELERTQANRVNFEKVETVNIHCPGQEEDTGGQGEAETPDSEKTGQDETVNGLTQEAVDLINGLQTVMDIGPGSQILQRLEILSRYIDEMTEERDSILSAKATREESLIVSLCFWMRDLFGALSHILEAQDHAILRLKQMIPSPENDSGAEREVFHPDLGKLGALRSLTELFHPDYLFTTNEVNVPDLKSWGAAYGIPYETVKTLLGSKAWTFKDLEADEAGA